MDILVFQRVVFSIKLIYSSEIPVRRICSLVPNSNCVPSFQLGTIIHNWELFQHEKKPSRSLSGLRFVGWSTHAMWASRAMVTVMVIALVNCPGQRARRSAGLPPQYLLLTAERAWSKIFTSTSVLTRPFEQPLLHSIH